MFIVLMCVYLFHIGQSEGEIKSVFQINMNLHDTRKYLKFGTNTVLDLNMT